MVALKIASLLRLNSLADDDIHDFFPGYVMRMLDIGHRNIWNKFINDQEIILRNVESNVEKVVNRGAITGWRGWVQSLGAGAELAAAEEYIKR